MGDRKVALFVEGIDATSLLFGEDRPAAAFLIQKVVQTGPGTVPSGWSDQFCAKSQINDRLTEDNLEREAIVPMKKY